MVDGRGPAAAAGISPGDRIVALAGRPTPNLLAFRQALAPLYAGRRVEVVIERAGERRTVEVTLAVKGS